MQLWHRPLRARVLLELAAGLALMGSAVAVAVVSDPSPGKSNDPSPIQLGAAEDGSGSSNANSTYRLRIPSISVNAPIVAVHIEDDGVLGIPAEPSEIGWWAEGPVPGSERGTSILAGHVNTAGRGPGALRSLENIREHDPIVVEGWGEPITFEVDQIVRYPRGDVPGGALEQDMPGRLAIVSCDDLDEETGQYRDNLFVYASRVGS